MPFQLIAQNTLLAICRAVAERLSLTPPTDPAGSTDPAIRLLVQEVNNADQELLNSYEWEALTKAGEIQVTTALPPTPGESSELAFDLPDDFYRFIDQTQWNAAMRFPAVGPVAPQGWMTYRIFPISANFTLTWQVREGQIWFLNPPADPGQAFKFMYLSQALVQDADDATLYKNVAEKNADVFVLDPLIIGALARVKWLESKGFDSTAAVRDFNTLWDTRVGVGKGANILNLAGGRHSYPYIGIGNLPEASLYGMRQN